jgi:hypothetical protein
MSTAPSSCRNNSALVGGGQSCGSIQLERVMLLDVEGDEVPARGVVASRADPGDAEALPALSAGPVRDALAVDVDDAKELTWCWCRRRLLPADGPLASLSKATPPPPPGPEAEEASGEAPREERRERPALEREATDAADAVEPRALAGAGESLTAKVVDGASAVSSSSCTRASATARSKAHCEAMRRTRLW